MKTISGHNQRNFIFWIIIILLIELAACLFFWNKLEESCEPKAVKEHEKTNYISVEKCNTKRI